MASNGSPVASAPAFVILIGLCSAIASRVAGYSPLISLTLAVLMPLAWIFLGSRHIACGWVVECALIITIVFLGSLWAFHKISFTGTFPFASFVTDAKVIMNRPWGRSRALLLETRYGRAVAYISGRSVPREGSFIQFRGAAFDLKRADTPRDFDEYLYWHARGAVKRMIIFESRITAQASGIAAWRSVVERRIRQSLPERTAGYMIAFTTGTRDEKITEVHRATGTQHLLAVSGFHVGIIAGLAMLLFRGRLARAVGVSIVVWFYVLFAGAPAGGIRAGLMLQIYLLGLAAGRPSSAFNSVSLAGVLMLLYNPWSYFDLGWRLSMCAALFFTALFSFMRSSFRNAALASVLIWIVTAPLVSFSFDTVPVAGLFVNIVAVPFFGVIFPAVIICSLPALAGFSSFAFIASGCEYFLAAWELFSDFVSYHAPWEISFSIPVAVLGAAVFLCVTTIASGYFPVGKR